MDREHMLEKYLIYIIPKIIFNSRL